MTHWTDDRQVRDDPGLRDLLSRLASTASEPVDPELRHRHLQAMLSATRDNTTAVPVPAVRWRRIRRISALTGTKLVLAAGVAAAAGTTGLAATGTLPPPAQHVVHDLGEHVGVDLPDAATVTTDTSDDPGPAVAPPQRVDPLPDKAADAPGHDGQLPDNAVDAPGHDGELPEQANPKASDNANLGTDRQVPPAAEDAPGQDGDLTDQPGGSGPTSQQVKPDDAAVDAGSGNGVRGRSR